MRLRVLPGIFLLATAAAPQEGPPPEPSPYAAMGFPVTFNEEVITANDVARFLDTPLADIDPNTLRRNRDLLLLRKINERIAANLSIEVGDQQVAEFVRREIDVHGGEAKFYEWLAQQGMTLERFRIERRQMIIDQLLRILLQNGVSHDHRQLLPWRVGPTPTEIQTAFRNDPERRGAALRVRRVKFTVDATREQRAALSVKQATRGMSADEVAAEIEKAVGPRVEAALAALKQRPFADVAREHGADVDAMRREWVSLGDVTEAEKFLAAAEPGTWSKPIRQPGGAYDIVLLVEREVPAGRKVTDPAVAEEYSRRIRSIRATKWEAFLRLRALADSTVEPPRVREELRSLILVSLREAEDSLNALGLR